MRSLSSLAADMLMDIEEINGSLSVLKIKEAGDYLVEKIKEGYDNQEMGGPSLAESTIARKGDDLKLIDTGAMRDSFEAYTIGKHLSVGSDYMAAEIGKPLCEIHEDGTTDGHIPARPMLVMIFDREQPKIEMMIFLIPE